MVVRGGVASTLPASSLRLDTSSLAVNLEKARDQQKEYVEVRDVVSRPIFHNDTSYVDLH